MKWANFLHIYQPADQQEDILSAVVEQSYRPLFVGLREHKRAKITLNINGALLELFDKFGHRDIIDMLRATLEEGRIEFTGSAKYHAFLPLIEEEEIARQIKANTETSRFFLGKNYAPRGFFPPEMAYDRKVGAAAAAFGFEWLILDEIAFSGKVGAVTYENVPRIKGTQLGVFFRERRLSNLIMSAVVRSGAEFLAAAKTEAGTGRYIVTGMDGETFGHHRPGLESMLLELFDAPQFEWRTLSELKDEYPAGPEVEPTPSTWASSEADIERGIQFLSWSDPDNEIHTAQWALVNLARAEVMRVPENTPGYRALREKMDAALASDQFWWASAKPWWSLEMIEDGAFRTLGIIKEIPALNEAKLMKANELYQKIISTAFLWQRTGKVRKMMQEQKGALRIPFKERTLGKGGEEEGVYYAFLDMMRRLEKEAAARGEYERAVLWRDAVYKLEHKQDIYDAINAVDLLRAEIPHPEVEATIQKYKKDYRKIRGGQPEQRGH